MVDLFSAAAAEALSANAPLAVRMRPRTVDEVVGQRHLLGSGSPLRRLVAGEGATSVILWGPPGTGKTTLAYVVAAGTASRFVELSAVTAGVKDVRALIEEARRRLGEQGERTVLFVDEVHRFSKTQQDALLPAVENRVVTLIAATTENPSFSVVAPLLSRSLLLTLQPLTDDDIGELVRRALAEDRGLGGEFSMSPDAQEHVLRVAQGDARRALTAVEAAADSARALGQQEISLAVLEESVDRAAVRYDRTGDQHYDVTSAFIKSMRGSDVDASLHYLARMLDAGEDARFIARRVVILASEDIGLADPSALQVAMAAAEAVQLIGLPEGQLALAQAVIHCALAPKSNAVMAALAEAAEDVRAGLAGPVPVHLRDGHSAGAQRLGHGQGYRYSHDSPGGVVAQQYAPDLLADRTYYRPTTHGAERVAGERLARLREALGRSSAPPTSAQSAQPAQPAQSVRAEEQE